jgi:hypothetical protein
LVKQQVPRLHVPVHDAPSMRRIQSGRRLVDPRQHVVDRRRPAAQPLLERPAAEKLHHDERSPLPLADVEDRDRPLLTGEPGRGQGLARKPGAQRLVPGVPLGEHLDRNHPPELLVLGAEDLAHAAVADPRGPAIPRWQEGFRRAHQGPRPFHSRSANVRNLSIAGPF